MRIEQLPDFTNWLQKCGVSIMAPTNEYEVLRFKTKQATSVIYRKQNGRFTFTGQAGDAFSHYTAKTAWNPDRNTRKKLSIGKKQFVADRDGPHCFYCATMFASIDDATIEHLLNVSHGGNNHPSNLTLACELCNREAADKTIVEKFQLKKTKEIK